MKKKITIRHEDCWELPFGVVCGCPLYEKMQTAGFAVDTIPDVGYWVDTWGRRHKFAQPFYQADYSNLLNKTKKVFSTVVSDED